MYNIPATLHSYPVSRTAIAIFFYFRSNQITGGKIPVTRLSRKKNWYRELCSRVPDVDEFSRPSMNFKYVKR